MFSMGVVNLASPKNFSSVANLHASHHSTQRDLCRSGAGGLHSMGHRSMTFARREKRLRKSLRTCAVPLQGPNDAYRIQCGLPAVGEEVGRRVSQWESRESGHSFRFSGRPSSFVDHQFLQSLHSSDFALSSGTSAALSSLIGLGILCTPAAAAAEGGLSPGWTSLDGISEEYLVSSTISLQKDIELVLEKQVSAELQTELALHNVLAPPLDADSDGTAACPSCGNSSGMLMAANALDSASATMTALAPVAAATTTAATAVAALSAPAVAARVAVGTAGVAAVASSTISTLQPPVAALGMTGPGVLGPLGTAAAQAVQHFGGGSIAGAVGATVVFPLDTVKTKMQAQKETEGEEPEYKDAFDCACQLVAKEGPGALYSGLVPQLIGIAPEKALKLTVNEMLLSMLQTQMPGSSIWALELLAGAGGGGSQVVFTNPVEIVKVRLQTQSEAGAKPKTAMEVVRELGLSGLYSGTLVTLARDVPSSSLFFGSYALLKPMFPGNAFFAGALAAAPATLLVTPMDVIKTRMQMELRAGEEPYKDAWDCMWRIVKQEGVSALFKGGMTRVLRVSPQFGITLAVYDLLC